MSTESKLNLSTSEARAVLQRIGANVKTVIRGQDRAIRLLLAGFAGSGHVLLEDVPGTGKTTLAKALARSVGADFKRVQFTPDLLPGDILGVSVFDQKEQAFRFCPGPVFAHVLLADEINRASPRTQSALLEAMAEAQVSVDGASYPLPQLFFVIATQNPVEFAGTYPLPEAQMDRFALLFAPGYVSAEEEAAVLADQELTHPLVALKPCSSLVEALAVRQRVREVKITPEVRRYIVDLAAATRSESGVRLGSSPRGALALMRCSQALSLLDGRDFVAPESVQELALPVIAHRLSLEPQARFSGLTGERVVSGILSRLQVPA